MTITFSCTCGAEFEVPDELIGVHAPCPNCQAALVVPGPDDDEPVSDLDVEEDTATEYGLADAAGTVVDDEPEVVEDADVVEEVEEVEDKPVPDDDATPEFFVAAYPPGTTLRHPKTFRFYSYGSELLVLHAGPFSWGLINVLLDRPGVRDEVRAAHRYDPELGGGVLGSDADAIARGKLAQRAAVLDRMRLSELKAEADADTTSFRITADTTPKARIEPPARDDFAETRTAHLTAGRLKFTHATAGKWDLALLSQADARMALKAFRRVLGDENVEVTLKLKDGRT